MLTATYSLFEGTESHQHVLTVCGISASWTMRWMSEELRECWSCQNEARQAWTTESLCLSESSCNMWTFGNRVRRCTSMKYSWLYLFIYLWFWSQFNIRFTLIFPDGMTFSVPPGFHSCLLSFLWKLNISVGSFGADCLLLTLSHYPVCHFWPLTFYVKDDRLPFVMWPLPGLNSVIWQLWVQRKRAEVSCWVLLFIFVVSVESLADQQVSPFPFCFSWFIITCVFSC